MGNILKEIMVFREYLTCDNEDCNNEPLTYSGQSTLTQDTRHTHTCPKCGHTQTGMHRFPRIVYKELPTIFESEGAIDNVIGKIDEAIQGGD